MPKSDGYDVETVLKFAEHLIANAAEMWQKADLDQRQQLQQVLFPAGISFQNGKFRTAITCALFNVLESAGGKRDQLASPRGFEPPTPEQPKGFAERALNCL